MTKSNQHASDNNVNFDNVHHNLHVNKAPQHSCNGIWQSKTANTDWREKHNRRPLRVKRTQVAQLWNMVGATS